MTTRFILIGGFLGAGKTTTISRLARNYRDRGLTVGIITNDQAADLVDTQMLRAGGFNVEEVAGACFCCNFDGMVESAHRLVSDHAPDVILAEPVGSCTDVAATVIQPLLRLFPGEFDVAPYGVIFKQSQGNDILAGRPSALSTEIGYIFTKQLEEADFVIVNRIDVLDQRQIDEVTGRIARLTSDVPIIPVSALTGAGFDVLLDILEQRGQSCRHGLHRAR